MKGGIPGNPDYIRSVLEQFGFEKIKRRVNGWNALCKFHPDRGRHFTIGDNGLWMCWTGTCDAKGNLQKLHELLGDGNFDWRKSLEILGVQLDMMSQPTLVKGRTTSEILPKAFRLYHDPKAVPDVIARRLKWDTIRKFRLGQAPDYPDRDRCIIPVRYGGRTVGYHGRALSNEMIPRYRNADGFKIKEYVFNWDGVEKGGEIIVLEGAFNAMSMTEKGFPNTVATFGTEFRPEQLGRLLKLNPKSLVLCFDRDKNKAGQKATVKLGKLLDDLVPTYVMPLPTGKDPNDLEEGILRECYRRKERFEDVIRSGRDGRNRKSKS